MSLLWFCVADKDATILIRTYSNDNCRPPYNYYTKYRCMLVLRSCLCATDCELRRKPVHCGVVRALAFHLFIWRLSHISFCTWICSVINGKYFQPHASQSTAIDIRESRRRETKQKQWINKIHFHIICSNSARHIPFTVMGSLKMKNGNELSVIVNSLCIPYSISEWA